MATSFNKKNVTHFQNNYKELLVKFQFTAMQTYNLDETDVTTVPQATRIVTHTGVKQLGHVAYAEKCQVAPVCTTITARGNVVPPVFVFPHARMCDALMIKAPEGNLCLANCPTRSWISSPLHSKVLEHIKKNTHSRKEDPILVLLDYHEALTPCHM
jgi:hypothetical protein